MIGNEMRVWISDLLPMHRAITGPGVRETIAYLQKILPGLQMCSVPTGTHAFDWKIPREWWPERAELWDADGNNIIDASKSNLHWLQYSAPFEGEVDLAELQQHLHSLPGQPDAIPYITSFYKEAWGLCLPHNERMKLKPGKYYVRIVSDLIDGVLNYAEWGWAGKTTKEILLTSNICHPELCNNELSGPVVLAAVARAIAAKPRRLTYRILFLPETIGAIYYISEHLEALKRNLIAGYHCICLGDARPLGWGERGSDERQWNSALVDLPVVTITRGKIGDYAEYHTSLDNLDFIKAENLEEAYRYILKIIEGHEVNKTYKAIFPCEPQLGKRGLYPQLSTKDSIKEVELMLGILRLCNGKRDLANISSELNADIFICSTIAERLLAAGVLEEVIETPAAQIKAA